MTTANDIIILALKDAQILDEDETPSATLVTDVFTTLKQLLTTWQVTPGFPWASQEISFVPDGSETYTLGLVIGATVSTSNKINSAFYRVGGLDYPIEQLDTMEEYNRICLKTLSSYPAVFYYESTYPLGTLYIYPQPNTGEVHLIMPVSLPEYTGTANALSFPPEYELAIRFSLAEIICIMMGKKLDPAMVGMALKQRKLLGLNNFKMDDLSGFQGSTDSNYLRIKRG